jgi:hypothetical protein
MEIFLAVAVLLASVVAVTQLLLAHRFSSKIAELGRRLTASQNESPPDQSQIPSRLRAFAERNGGHIGGPLVVEMAQSAEMRLRVDQPYFPLNASQLSGTRNPGFVWQARGTMSKLLPLRIVDAYVEGAGELQVRIAGSIRVASATGPETAKGEALRFLAELPWNPDAILNAQGLRWRELDGGSVEVSMQTSGGLARLSLHFDDAGDVSGVEALDRPRAGASPARWIGRFSDYAQVGLYRFPLYGEVAWALAEGEFVYWRGKILSVAPSQID